MDISTITNLQELKALAYDELVKKDVAERNITTIGERIAQIAGQVVEEASPSE